MMGERAEKIATVLAQFSSESRVYALTVGARCRALARAT